jgi:Cu2+-containing amine oxidase
MSNEKSPLEPFLTRTYEPLIEILKTLVGTPYRVQWIYDLDGPLRIDFMDTGIIESRHSVALETIRHDHIVIVGDTMASSFRRHQNPSMS